MSNTFTRVYTYEKDFQDFIANKETMQVLQVDEELFDYFLEVLPPLFMSCTVNCLPGHEGHAMKVDFGFAEGAEPITCFWRSPDGKQFFAQQTERINPYA